MKKFALIKSLVVGSSIALSAMAFSAHAQAPAMPAGHAGMDHSAHGASSSPANASTKAYQASDEKMMKDMGVPYTGDADKDFVSHMIPHHEGAVAMAEIVLKYGKDPELRKMAREIVKAQDKEIAFMKKWQARNGVK